MKTYTEHTELTETHGKGIFSNDFSVLLCVFRVFRVRKCAPKKRKAAFIALLPCWGDASASSTTVGKTGVNFGKTRMVNRMPPEQIIQKTAEYVKGEFERDSSGHDWWHIARVWKTALALCRYEGGDVFTVELAALLHDLDDWKLVPSPLHLSTTGSGAGGEGRPVRAEAWLRQMGVDSALTEHICEIITGLSFKGALVETPMRTLEGQIVQDADRLDAIGAIGIARAFAYGGHKGRLLYDPASPPQMHASFEQYQNSGSATINHFYEKLLLLKDRMNTPTAKRIAAGRHAYMEEFLQRFMKEWEGGEFEKP